MCKVKERNDKEFSVPQGRNRTRLGSFKNPPLPAVERHFETRCLTCASVENRRQNMKADAGGVGGMMFAFKEIPYKHEHTSGLVNTGSILGNLSTRLLLSVAYNLSLRSEYYSCTCRRQEYTKKQTPEIVVVKKNAERNRAGNGRFC